MTTQQLAKQGVTVVMSVRRVEEGKRVAAEIRQALPSAKLAVYRLALDDLASLRAFAVEVNREHPKLQGLVNNAGVMKTPFGRTNDGFETQFGVNHLGHFLLTELLLNALKAGAPSRVVNLSSYFHEFAMGRKGEIHFEDLNYEQRPFDTWEAYAHRSLPTCCTPASSAAGWPAAAWLPPASIPVLCVPTCSRFRCRCSCSACW